MWRTGLPGKRLQRLVHELHTWLSRLVPDIDAYLSYAKQLGKRSGYGLSLRYFSLGEIILRDANGNDQGTLQQ